MQFLHGDANEFECLARTLRSLPIVPGWPITTFQMITLLGKMPVARSGVHRERWA
jgi:hypothetical protein